jgi:hypothetical protein
MISKKEAESAVLEEAAAAFLVASDQVDNAASSVVSARHQLHEAEEHEGADEDAADAAAKNHGEGKKKGRRCTAELKLALARFNISVQRYWNGSLVGPDCKLFTDNYIDVLTQVRLKIDELFPGSSKATLFFLTDTPRYFSMSTLSVICPEKSPCSLLVSSMRSKRNASNLVARFDCHTPTILCLP